MNYQQLTEGQRYQIALLYEDKFSLTAGQDRTLSELNHVQVIRNYPNKIVLAQT